MVGRKPYSAQQDLSACLLAQPLEAILELGLSPFVAVKHGLEQLFLLL